MAIATYLIMYLSFNNHIINYRHIKKVNFRDFIILSPTKKINTPQNSPRMQYIRTCINTFILSIIIWSYHSYIKGQFYGFTTKKHSSLRISRNLTRQNKAAFDSLSMCTWNGLYYIHIRKIIYVPLISR